MVDEVDNLVFHFFCPFLVFVLVGGLVLFPASDESIISYSVCRCKGVNENILTFFVGAKIGERNREPKNEEM